MSGSLRAEELWAKQQQDIANMFTWQFPMHGPQPQSGLISRLCGDVCLAGKRILEPGCHEGHCTVALSKAGGIVTALDARPENLVRAFARCLYSGVKCHLRLGTDADVEAVSDGAFDLLFHAGLFYHLPDPVRHLQRISSLFPLILLETHILHPAPRKRGFGKFTRRHGYGGRLCLEGRWVDRLAGISTEAFWLYESELMRLVGDCGLKVRSHYGVHLYPKMRFPRIALLLERE